MKYLRGIMLICLFLVADSAALSPPCSFVMTIGGESTDACLSIAETGDGGYITGGYTCSFGAVNQDAFVAKFDSASDFLWGRMIGGSDTDCIFSVTGTYDGGIVATGYTKSFSTTEALLLLKLNSEGETLWTRVIGVLDSTADYRGYSVIETSDSDIVVAGFRYLLNPGRHELLISKFNSNGEILWTKAGFLVGRGHYGYSVVETCDGGFIVAGRVWRPLHGADALFVKFDSNGHYLWSWWIGQSYCDETVYSISRTSDCGFAITGVAEDTLSGRRRTFVMKRQHNFNPQWKKIFTNAIELNTEGRAVIETPSNEILVAGDWCTTGMVFEDIMLSKFKPNGNLVWSKGFNYIPEVSPVSLGMDLIYLNGFYYIAGYTLLFGHNGEIAKFTASGDVCCSSDYIAGFVDWYVIEDTLQLLCTSPSISVVSPQVQFEPISFTLDTICQVFYLCGDCNCDSAINQSDLIYFARYLYSGGPPPADFWSADLNCDGEINHQDLVILANYLFQGAPAPQCCPIR